MDNLTHSLIGLTAAKAGLEKLSPGATALCILAANSPDSDIVVLIFGGRWEFLQHHRGITHSILGSLVLAIALPLVFYATDLLIAAIRTREPKVKLKGLLLASLLATATHPIMDWTNNYGMRFLLPWNPRWFYGDFVFIIDPFIWMVLGGAAFLLTSKTGKQVGVWIALSLIPTYIVIIGAAGTGMLTNQVVLRVLWIVGLIVLVVLYRNGAPQRYGASMAIAALVTVTIYCSVLAATHAVALGQAKSQAAGIAQPNGERVLNVAAMPTMANPVNWVCAMETDRATYRFDLSLRRVPDQANLVRFEKPSGNGAEIVAIAAQNTRSKIFLGFARFPVVRVVGEDCLTQTLVQFADLRYTEPGRGRGTFSLDVPVECPALERR
jgi:inner membrane protein